MARFHGDFKGNFKGNFKDLDIWSDAVALKKNLQEFGIFNYFKIKFGENSRKFLDKYPYTTETDGINNLNFKMSCHVETFA